MAAIETGFKCRNCGKEIDILHPLQWAYKVKNNKGGHNYFCSWKCLREDERKKDKKKAARKEESEQRTRNDRKDVLEKLMDAAEAGRDIYAYLREEGYTDPKDTLRRLRIKAKKEAPEIYRKMEQMGLLDLRAKNSGKGVDKMSQNKLTREQKEKAVKIALEGGDFLEHLKKCGAKNPSAAWWYIKKTLAKSNPKLLAEVTERPEENQMKVTELEKTDDGVKLVVSVPPEKAEQMDKVIKELIDPENDRLGLSLYKDAQRITEPLKYDGFRVTAINGEFGEYNVGMNPVSKEDWFEFESLDKKTRISMYREDLAAFIEELTRAAQILGVKV